MDVFESSGALQVSQICRIRSGTLRWRISTVKLFLGVLVMTFSLALQTSNADTLAPLAESKITRILR